MASGPRAGRALLRLLHQPRGRARVGAVRGGYHHVAVGDRPPRARLHRFPGRIEHQFAARERGDVAVGRVVRHVALKKGDRVPLPRERVDQRAPERRVPVPPRRADGQPEDYEAHRPGRGAGDRMAGESARFVRRGVAARAGALRRSTSRDTRDVTPRRIVRRIVRQIGVDRDVCRCLAATLQLLTMQRHCVTLFTLEISGRPPCRSPTRHSGATFPSRPTRVRSWGNPS